MRILHTSDWHLGRSLVQRKRYDEFNRFLDWLIKTVEERSIDALIVAGDIFDNTTPGNQAQAMYYSFLGRAANTCCNNIIVISGNHDSPTFLEAPKQILSAINVHVIGTASDNPEDEVIVLKDQNNVPQAIVCAVPYLRDRDIRTVKPGETIEDKAANLIKGMQNHYASVCAFAENKRQELGDLPLIATGHLFTAGGKTVEGDGVRELYVGTIAHVSTDLFPPGIDYLALGHLHMPQKVGGHDHIRYCGSPIPMNFAEAKQQKKVIQVEFTGRSPQIEEINLPCFQTLEKISGDMEEIRERIAELVSQKSNAWLEIEYTGQHIVADLDQGIFDAIAGSQLIVTRNINRTMQTLTFAGDNAPASLDGMSEVDVFEHCLDAQKVPEEQRAELMHAYSEILTTIAEDDANRD